MIFDFSANPQATPGVAAFPVQAAFQDLPTPPDQLIDTTTLAATDSGTVTISASVDDPTQ